MKKKLYIALFIFSTVLAFSFSYTLAANSVDPAQGIRNAVGGAENVVEDAGKGLASGIKNITSGAQNTMENATDGNNKAQGTTNNASAQNRSTGAMTTDNNNNYTATRTATTTGDASTFLGMNSTAWTWLIMAIVGVAIIALVWMYAKQNDRSSYHDDNY